MKQTITVTSQRCDLWRARWQGPAAAHLPSWLCAGPAPALPCLGLESTCLSPWHTMHLVHTLSLSVSVTLTPPWLTALTLSPNAHLLGSLPPHTTKLPEHVTPAILQAIQAMRAQGEEFRVGEPSPVSKTRAGVSTRIRPLPVTSQEHLRVSGPKACVPGSWAAVECGNGSRDMAVKSPGVL